MRINESKIERIKKGKPFSVFDIVAISLALIISLGYIIYMFATREEGAQAAISVQGGGIYYYSLQEDKTITENDIGLTRGHIKIIISKGKIYVDCADCDNQICVYTGSIMYKGQSITCLPLGVHIRIPGGLNLVTG